MKINMINLDAYKTFIDINMPTFHNNYNKYLKSEYGVDARSYDLETTTDKEYIMVMVTYGDNTCLPTYYTKIEFDELLKIL